MPLTDVDPKTCIECPRCSQHQFGVKVISVGGDSYARRCRNCAFQQKFTLPQIRKKVIYLDQSIVSDIMKFLNPETLGHVNASSNPLNKDLFEALSVLLQLQLVCCPKSEAHRHESLSSPFYQEVKRALDYLSVGIGFVEAEQIRLNQIAAKARAWLRNDQPTFDFRPQSILSGGRIDCWNPRLIITSDGFLPGTVDNLRASRSLGHQHLQTLFTKWQEEKPDFKDVFETEKNAYGRSHFQVLAQQYQKRRQIAESIALRESQTYDQDDFQSSESDNIFLTLSSIFHDGLGQTTANAKLIEFFSSGAINETPFNHIQSAMAASLAVKAATGQKRLPDQGTLTDMTIVSTLLPYCDAMFVDNRCRALIEDIPREYAPKYSCELFSYNVGDEFLQYLRDLVETASSSHIALVKAIYGFDPLKPPDGIAGLGRYAHIARLQRA